MNSSLPETNDTVKGYPMKLFGTVRQKKAIENCDISF